MEPGTEQLLIGAAIGAILGFLLGYVFGRRSAPGSQQVSELEQKLEDAMQAKQEFKERVTVHFVESAQKLNTLTEQYREVHLHLAAGAENLCGEGTGGAFEVLGTPPAETLTIESDELVMEPPRDYAPKSSPDEPGILNERFGLDKDAPPGSSDAPKS